MTSASLVSIDGVSFAYGSERVLEDVGFAIEPKTFVALVGPNGSGKSTLLRILLGILRPDAGHARLFGRDPARRIREPWRIGYVPQRPALAKELPATVADVVATGRLARIGWRGRLRALDREAFERALLDTGLTELAGRTAGELSGGEQQRAFIARAIVNDPDLLVLDEPVAGVDRRARDEFRATLTHLVRDHGTAVLLVSHELGAVADVLDRVIVLRRRVLFDGPPGELAETGVSLGIHRQDLPLWLEDLA